MAFRIDSSPLGKHIKLDNGWLRAPAYIARTGVLEYRLPDGSVRRELRLPEEVFKQDALDSFELVPLVDDHPLEGELNAKNTALYSAGAVGKVHQDGEYVAAEVLVQDARAISKVEAGKHEVSCAYHADLEMTPGVWNGQRYDCIQRNIRGNHVALVRQGRAGPDVKLRLDSADVGVLVSDAEQTGSVSVARVPMLKFKIDGVEYEVSEQVAQAVAKERAAAAALLDAVKADRDTIKGEVEKHKAHADSADRKVAELQKELAEAPVKIAASVKARGELESVASEFLGKEMKLDGLSDLDVRKQVLAKILKTDGADLADKSEAYIQARFDFEVERERAANPASAQMAERVKRADAADPQLTPEQNFYKVIASKYEVKA
jgi:hypothetical protein